jgi:zinc-ribbon domain
VTICTVCGQENPEGFRFCGACASPLATGEVGQREERKVVTALFCDLVGFTSLSETADPEDVNTMLDAYSAMVRAQIETTAAWFRSSATPSWGCSAYRLRTRITRSGRYGPVFESRRRRRS